MYSTRLRHLNAESPIALEDKIEKLPFKVEIKQILQDRSGNWFCFFTLLDTYSLESDPDKKKKKVIRKKTNRS